MTKRKGVWNLQQVRDNILESTWTQSTRMWAWGYGSYDHMGGAFPGGANFSLRQAAFPAPSGFADTNWTQIGNGGISQAAVYAWVGEDTTYVMGSQRSCGALGLNEDSGTQDDPAAFPAGSGRTWKNIANGYTNTLAVKDNGELWTWGNNEHGQLGQNNTTQYSSPVQVGTDTTWSGAQLHIASSDSNQYAIKTDGSMWSWGYNGPWGPRLNDNGPANTKRSSPVQCVGGTNWESIGLGGLAGIQKDGTLWAWGINYLGSLGTNQGNQQGGNPGGSWSSARQVGTDTDWKKVMRTTSNMFALKTNDTLWVCGTNQNGGLGLNTVGSPAPYWGTQFSGSKSSPTQLNGTWGNFASMDPNYGLIGMKPSGQLWAWGGSSPYYSNLLCGDCGDGIARSSPVQVTGQSKWSLREGAFSNHYYGHLGLGDAIPADDM